MSDITINFINKNLFLKLIKLETYFLVLKHFPTEIVFESTSPIALIFFLIFLSVKRQSNFETI